jgi:hypothetical protein
MLSDTVSGVPGFLQPTAGLRQERALDSAYTRTPLCSEPDAVLSVVRTLILLVLLIGSVENVGLFSQSAAFGCDCHR